MLKQSIQGWQIIMPATSKWFYQHTHNKYVAYSFIFQIICIYESFHNKKSGKHMHHKIEGEKS
jgi:hypothetical protein